MPVATSGDPQTGRTIAEVASFDMKVSGWFKPLDLGAVSGDLKSEGVGVDTARWKEAGAYGVIKYRSAVTGGRLTIDFKLYEVEKGDSPVLQRTYRGAAGDVRKLTHMWCNEVVKYFTGEPGFFGSKLAFCRQGRAAQQEGDGGRLRRLRRVLGQQEQLDQHPAGVVAQRRRRSPSRRTCAATRTCTWRRPAADGRAG